MAVIAISTPQITQATEIVAQANPQANKQLNDLLEQGRKLVDSGDVENAISIYTQAVSLDPRNPKIYSGIAYLEALRGNFQVAAQYYQNALILEPNNADFQYGLGFTLANLQQYDAAAGAIVEPLCSNETTSRLTRD